MQDKKGLAEDIVKKLVQNGHRAVFIGGCVRDMIMGRAINDYDIATSAPPDEVCRLFERTIQVGAAFGVVLVVKEGVNFEVATFRSDDAYIDGRHPVSVRFTTLEEDINRRDFTINALAYDPLNGDIIDLVGGREDIGKKIIKTVGEPRQRFKEDKLRMLRGIRFASKLGFEFEPDTWRATCELAPEINSVSNERIYNEITNIITNRGSGRALDLLLESGLLAIVLPEVAIMAGVEQPEQFHPEGDVFVHTKMTVDYITENLEQIEVIDEVTPELAWAALLHDVGKPPTFVNGEDRIRFDHHVSVGAEMAEKICRRMKMSRASMKRIIRYIENHMRFINVQQMRESKLKRFLQQEYFNEELALHLADCMASHGDADNYHFCNGKIAEYGEEVIKPAPLINGDVLIAEGYKPGPIFAEILNKVQDEQLEGRITDKDSAIIFVRQAYPVKKS